MARFATGSGIAVSLLSGSGLSAAIEQTHSRPAVSVLHPFRMSLPPPSGLRAGHEHDNSYKQELRSPVSSQDGGQGPSASVRAGIAAAAKRTPPSKPAALHGPVNVKPDGLRLPGKSAGQTAPVGLVTLLLPGVGLVHALIAGVKGPDRSLKQ